MSRHNFSTRRMFVSDALAEDSSIALSRSRANYLLNVLRMKAGDEIAVFNGVDGEWRAAIAVSGRKEAVLELSERIREQTVAGPIEYAFAPIKSARMEYVVQKAVEMGAGRIQPVITEFTQSPKLKPDKLVAYAVEAAEQCGVLCLPEIAAPMSLESYVSSFDPDRALIFCDEEAEMSDPIEELRKIGTSDVSIVIGPEGGFSPAERALLRQQDFTQSLSLGPRILRADTAAVAALALVQATIGDWAVSQK